MENPLVHLHQFIVDHYDLEELRTLCFSLSVNYDSLRGEGHAAKARELVLYLGRQQRFDALLEALKQERLAVFDQSGLSTDSVTLEALNEAMPVLKEELEGGGIPPGKRQRLEALRQEIRDLLVLFERAAFRPYDGDNRGDPTAVYNAVYETRIQLQQRGAIFMPDDEIADQFGRIQRELLKLENEVKRTFPRIASLAAELRDSPIGTQYRLTQVRAELGDEQLEQTVYFLRSAASEIYDLTDSVRQSLKELNHRLA
jgi:hypothetical protein